VVEIYPAMDLEVVVAQAATPATVVLEQTIT
jgi:hypothetical protein